MPESRPTPTHIKFVRRLLRRQPTASFEQVLEAWQAQRGAAVQGDAAAIRQVYDEEVASVGQDKPPRDPNHSRTVWLTVAAWFAVHVALWGALGVPAYSACLAAPRSSRIFSCGGELGMVALTIGVLQLLYGPIIGALASRWRQAIGQGILIASGVTALLFTVLCFAAATPR